VSSPINPLDNLPPLEVEAPPISSAIEPKPKSDENPPWNGWDVLVIVGTTVGASFVLGMSVILAAKLIFLRGLDWAKLAGIPELILVAQLLTYIVVFAVMYWMVATRTGNFWKSIRWEWPRSWWMFLSGGAGLYIVLAGLGQLLPIPKHLPIDRFFDSAREATLMSVFAVTVAPLMEELFFRGFLYPVLARKWGMTGSILLTGAAFGILHGAQLKYSWAVLIIFLVGIALTTVRAVTKSVAASFMMHVGYNGTLSLLIYFVTGGFRHLEKISQ
jgi:hypothetical protein